MSKSTLDSCPDCGTPPGHLHEDYCDIERCPDCGLQFLSCGCAQPLRFPRLAWTGKYPGEVECREYGFWARWVPGQGWVAAPGDSSTDSTLVPDLNRLYRECFWDQQRGRFVLSS